MNTRPENDPQTRDALLAALAWQIELGADECIADTPANRFEETGPRRAQAKMAQGSDRAKPSPPKPPRTAPPPPHGGDEDPASPETLAEARRLAGEAASLEELRAAMAGFTGCALKNGAKNTVFADGTPGARVMFIGEAPGREEDRAGTPFIGPAGALLDRMLAAIGLDRHAEDRERAAYLAHSNPWRPVESRDPSPNEALILSVFLERHITLAAPDLVVSLGRMSAGALTGRPVRITRERGQWVSSPLAGGRPVLMMLHPDYLLRSPLEKARSWQDLLRLRAVLDGAPPPIDAVKQD